MTCYEILIKLAQNGYDNIRINLTTKTLKVWGVTLIEKGEVKNNKIKIGDDEYEFDDLITTTCDLNQLYQQYKFSMPSERDGHRHYFKALDFNELSDEQMIIGLPRLEARIRLEAYILLSSVSHKIKWNDQSHWFWIGTDPDFVILKEYIV